MHTLQAHIRGKIVELQVWDTAGMEQFRSMVKVFFKGANAILLVYDITRRDTFSASEMWLKTIQENSSSNVKIVLVGNKKDDEANRVVTAKEGKEFGNLMGIFHFMEKSAKTGEGISEMLKVLALQLYNDHINNPIKKEDTTKLSNDDNKQQTEKCC